MSSAIEILATMRPSLRKCSVFVEGFTPPPVPEGRVLRSARRSKENAVDALLRGMVEDKTIPAYVHDKVFWEGLRPDFLWDLGDAVVILEVDEKQHKAYAKFGESAREMKLVEGCCGRPLVLIRYNPDSVRGGNIPQTQRHESLCILVSVVLSRPAAEKRDAFTRYKLFYDCECAKEAKNCDFVHRESWKSMEEYVLGMFGGAGDAVGLPPNNQPKAAPKVTTLPRTSSQSPPAKASGFVPKTVKAAVHGDMCTHEVETRGHALARLARAQFDLEEMARWKRRGSSEFAGWLTRTSLPRHAMDIVEMISDIDASLREAPADPQAVASMRESKNVLCAKLEETLQK
jgi:hypothetical protein